MSLYEDYEKLLEQYVEMCHAAAALSPCQPSFGSAR